MGQYYDWPKGLMSVLNFSLGILASDLGSTKLLGRVMTFGIKVDLVLGYGEGLE